MTLFRFTIRYIIFGFVLGLFSWMLAMLFPKHELFVSNYWIIFLFLFLLTYIAYFISDFGLKKTPQMGVVAIMGGIILKLLFALSFSLVILTKTAENQLVFVLNYFSLYLLFTLFEVMCLLRNLRDQNNK
ncbi:hypothetical protein [Olivibacter sp. XZL3]|uniref:hypothetical protein n=1 Tax=Olivibacter sp. XZL3 TaxID=1735116 RepID=UPI001064D560|nr:hypothetical protein [Olivibacter sp. XZL3]